MDDDREAEALEIRAALRQSHLAQLGLYVKQARPTDVRMLRKRMRLTQERFAKR